MMALFTGVSFIYENITLRYKEKGALLDLVEKLNTGKKDLESFHSRRNNLIKGKGVASTSKTKLLAELDFLKSIDIKDASTFKR